MPPGGWWTVHLGPGHLNWCMAGKNDKMTKTDTQWLELAQSSGWVRPLTPYPHWRFNIDWDNKDHNIPLRREIWEQFRDQGRFVPVDISWHHETRLRVILSNDVSQQLFIAGCLEPNEMAFLDHFLKPGMKVIDIGANEGCYSVFCGAKVGKNGKVWAFEPSPREFAVLKANADQNPHLNISCFPIALGNKNGTEKLRIAEGVHSGQNTLGEFSYSINELDCAVVSLRRLDDLFFEYKPDRIDLIKIDVEGAEGLVLEGARRTLETYRPVVLLEVLEKGLAALGYTPIRVINQFRGLGYRLAVFDPKTGSPKEYQGTGEGFSENLLAFPAEMGAALEISRLE